MGHLSEGEDTAEQGQTGAIPGRQEPPPVPPRPLERAERPGQVRAVQGSLEGELRRPVQQGEQAKVAQRRRSQEQPGVTGGPGGQQSQGKEGGHDRLLVRVVGEREGREGREGDRVD